LARQCNAVFVEKDWSADDVTRFPFLPRMCELRKAEAVEDWVESKLTLFEALQAAAGKKRQTRQSTSLSFQASKDVSDESESADSDVDSDIGKRPSTSRAATKTRSAAANARSAGKRSYVPRSRKDSSGEEFTPVTQTHTPVRSPKKRQQQEKEVPSKRSFFSDEEPSNATEIAMKLMVQATQSLRSDFDQMKKDQRNCLKRMQQVELTLGKLASNRPHSDDAYSHLTDSSGAFHEVDRRRRESTDSSNLEPTCSRANPRLSVGSIAWISQTYGANSKAIIRSLQSLGIDQRKWAMLFDARFNADKLLAQRILHARFTDAELANFVMSRPNQTRPRDILKQPLKGPDGNLLAPTKSLLPNQTEMMGKFTSIRV
jgi:hypothetical protein